MAPTDHGRGHRRDATGDWSARTTALVIVLVALVFAYLVWPTPWQYVSHQFLATRVHRVTGHAQVLTGDGWRAVDADYVDATSERVRQWRLRTIAERRAAGEDRRAVRDQWRARASDSPGVDPGPGTLALNRK